MKRIYKKKDLKKKFKRIFNYYEKNLFKPCIYEKSIFKFQARFYFFKERLNKGKEIYYFSNNDSDSDTGSSSLISNNDDILERFKSVIFTNLSECGESQNFGSFLNCDKSDRIKSILESRKFSKRKMDLSLRNKDFSKSKNFFDFDNFKKNDDKKLDKFFNCDISSFNFKDTIKNNYKNEKSIKILCDKFKFLDKVFMKNKKISKPTFLNSSNSSNYFSIKEKDKKKKKTDKNNNLINLITPMNFRKKNLPDLMKNKYKNKKMVEKIKKFNKKKKLINENTLTKNLTAFKNMSTKTKKDLKEVMFQNKKKSFKKNLILRLSKENIFLQKTKEEKEIIKKKKLGRFEHLKSDQKRNLSKKKLKKTKTERIHKKNLSQEVFFKSRENLKKKSFKSKKRRNKSNIGNLEYYRKNIKKFKTDKKKKSVDLKNLTNRFKKNIRLKKEISKSDRGSLKKKIVKKFSSRKNSLKRNKIPRHSVNIKFSERILSQFRNKENNKKNLLWQNTQIILDKSKLKKILTLDKKRKKKLKKNLSRRKMKTFDHKNVKINFFKKYGSISDQKKMKKKLLKNFSKEIKKPKKFRLKSLKKKISKEFSNLRNKKKTFNKITKKDLKLLTKFKKDKFPDNLKRYTAKFIKKDINSKF